MINVILFTVLTATQPSPLQSMLLGEEYLKAGRAEEAIVELERALDSGELSEFAKITIYWNLHNAYDSLKKYDSAAENLIFFLLNSESMLEFLEEINRPEHPGHSFVRAMNLKNRMLYSRVLLEIYWSKHNPSNCRAKETACTLPIKELYGLYAIRLFCDDPRKIKDVQRVEEDLIHLKVKCEDREEEYYFR